MQLEAQLATIDGRGVGRWRKWYDAHDLLDAAGAARYLTPRCLVRVTNGSSVIYGPSRAEDLVAWRQDVMSRSFEPPTD